MVYGNNTQSIPSRSIMSDIDVDDLRNTGEDRLVVSLMVDADLKVPGQLVGFKFIMLDGSSEFFFMNGKFAYGLISYLRQPFKTKRYTDRRRKEGDPRPDEPMVENFLANQPDILDEEWDGDRSQIMVNELKSFEFDNAFIFLVSLSDGQVYRYIVPDQVSLYLLEYLEYLEDRLNK